MGNLNEWSYAKLSGQGGERVVGRGKGGKSNM